jgi:hypothetical protein
VEIKTIPGGLYPKIADFPRWTDAEGFLLPIRIEFAKTVPNKSEAFQLANQVPNKSEAFQLANQVPNKSDVFVKIVRVLTRIGTRMPNAPPKAYTFSNISKAAIECIFELIPETWTTLVESIVVPEIKPALPEPALPKSFVDISTSSFYINEKDSVGKKRLFISLGEVSAVKNVKR